MFWQITCRSCDTPCDALLSSAPSPSLPGGADVSNDVRRAAVLNLGFLLASTPEQCPKIVSLLAESYNPHVR